MSIDSIREGFVLYLEGLRAFGRGKQDQNGKDANGVLKLEESNSSPLWTVEIVGDGKSLGRVKPSWEVY